MYGRPNLIDAIDGLMLTANGKQRKLATDKLSQIVAMFPDAFLAAKFQRAWSRADIRTNAKTVNFMVMI